MLFLNKFLQLLLTQAPFQALYKKNRQTFFIRNDHLQVFFFLLTHSFLTDLANSDDEMHPPFSGDLRFQISHGRGEIAHRHISTTHCTSLRHCTVYTPIRPSGGILYNVSNPFSFILMYLTIFADNFSLIILLPSLVNIALIIRCKAVIRQTSSEHSTPVQCAPLSSISHSPVGLETPNLHI